MKKINLFLVIILLFSFNNLNIRLFAKTDVSLEISREILKEAKNLKNKNIAVVDFTDIDGQESIEGRIIAERLIADLVSSGEVTVVERSQLKKVLEEQSTEISGAVDNASAVSLGKILGVEAIVTGTIVNFVDKNEIYARLINIENGKILSAVNIEGENISGITDTFKGEQAEKEIGEEEKKAKNTGYENNRIKRDKEKRGNIPAGEKFEEVKKLLKDNPKLFFAVMGRIIREKEEIARLNRLQKEDNIRFEKAKKELKEKQNLRLEHIRQIDPEVFRREKFMEEITPLVIKYLGFLRNRRPNDFQDLKKEFDKFTFDKIKEKGFESKK